jgi:hypothetical protein
MFWLTSRLIVLTYKMRLSVSSTFSLYSLMGIAMASTSTSNSTTIPVTRIACFKFHANVTAEQKGGRTSAFLDLYAQHPELLVAPPRGGRPLNTPLDLTNVKRDMEWDTGFIVVFKVRKLGLNLHQREEC